MIHSSSCSAAAGLLYKAVARQEVWISGALFNQPARQSTSGWPPSAAGGQLVGYEGPPPFLPK